MNVKLQINWLADHDSVSALLEGFEDKWHKISKSLENAWKQTILNRKIEGLRKISTSLKGILIP